VEFLCRAVRLSCGQLHTAVVSSSGDVYTWGKSQRGRLVNISDALFICNHTLCLTAAVFWIGCMIHFLTNCLRKSLAKCIYPKFQEIPQFTR